MQHTRFAAEASRYVQDAHEMGAVPMIASNDGDYTLMVKFSRGILAEFAIAGCTPLREALASGPITLVWRGPTCNVHTLEGTKRRVPMRVADQLLRWAQLVELREYA